MVAKFKPRRQFIDCLGVCNMRVSQDWGLLIRMVNAATGWDLNTDDAVAIADRAINTLRAFNLRHGVSLDVEAPSEWYGSVPVDGPAKGRDIMVHWDHMLDAYYKHMGWDRKSGRPLPETLHNLGLDREKDDLWK
jgi:aldehyde:ferredoxin oxidoreductase